MDSDPFVLCVFVCLGDYLLICCPEKNVPLGQIRLSYQRRPVKAKTIDNILHHQFFYFFFSFTLVYPKIDASKVFQTSCAVFQNIRLEPGKQVLPFAFILDYY